MAGTWLWRTMQLGRGADLSPISSASFIARSAAYSCAAHRSPGAQRLGGCPRCREDSGQFSVELARRLTTGRLKPLEPQPEMLAHARRELVRGGLPKAGFHIGCAAGRFHFPDSCFDVAFLATVPGEVTDKPACIRSVARILRLSGLLVVEEFFPDLGPRDAHGTTRSPGEARAPGTPG
jgi:SAM-dependent methyltransferase